MKSDYIEILGIRAKGFHGVFEEERRNGQDFVVDVRLYLSLSPASKHDDVSQTVNYAEVATLIENHIKGEAVNLIEALAERIAQACLNFERVESVQVKVHKPQAPIAVDFADVSVCINRKKS